MSKVLRRRVMAGGRGERAMQWRRDLEEERHTAVGLAVERKEERWGGYDPSLEPTEPKTSPRRRRRSCRQRVPVGGKETSTLVD